MLGQIAMGLRQAGRVLSPEVSQLLGQQETRAMDAESQQAQQTKILQLQQIIKGVESGAIPAEAGQAALKQLGVDVPVGPDAGTMERQQKVKNESDWRQAMVDADGDELKIATAGFKYGKPELAMGLIDKREARAQKAQEARDAAIERADRQTETINFRYDQLAQNARTDAERIQLTADRNRDLAADAKRSDETRRYTAELSARTSRELAEIRRAVAGAGKPLPSPLQKQLTEASELSDSATRFTTTFKPEYGGKTVIGGLGNTAGRIFGDDTGQSQWWQDYELHQSQIRNKLFGSALTAPEIAAWEKSSITPRMDSKQIKENLDRRETLEQRAVDRLMKGASVTYNKEQIEAFTGRSIAAKAPKITGDDDPLYQSLKPGAPYIGPDGKPRTKK